MRATPAFTPRHSWLTTAATLAPLPMPAPGMQVVACLACPGRATSAALTHANAPASSLQVSQGPVWDGLSTAALHTEGSWGMSAGKLSQPVPANAAGRIMLAGEPALCLIRYQQVIMQSQQDPEKLFAPEPAACDGVPITCQQPAVDSPGHRAGGQGVQCLLIHLPPLDLKGATAVAPHNKPCSRS